MEIGSTISHFVIASLLCLFVASLEGVSEMLIAGVEVQDGSQRLAKEKELGGVQIESKKRENGSIVRKPLPVGVVSNGGEKSTSKA